MTDKKLKQEFQNISKILASWEDDNMIFLFLRDLLSEKEILEFSRRFQVAQMLENKIQYSKIEKETSMSSTTIARISKYLNGKNQGYQKAIKTLKAISGKHHEAHT